MSQFFPSWDQKDVRYKMHYNGYTAETMKQLDKFLLPEVKEFGEWMRGELEKDRARIAEVYQKMYYAMFPAEEMYFPSQHVALTPGPNPNPYHITLIHNPNPNMYSSLENPIHRGAW